MGFPPAEVEAGVRELLAGEGLAADAETRGDDTVLRVRGLLLRIGPLPAGRATLALFHPRTLLVLEGEGALAERLKNRIRLKFLRVAG